MKELIKKLKKIDSMFHINNFYPNYVTKWVFKVGFFILIIGWLYVAFTQNFDLKPHAYIECDSSLFCVNPFYYCQNETGVLFLDYTTLNCDSYNKFNCIDNVCSKSHLEPNEVLGVKPPKIYSQFVSFVFWMVVLMLIINHLIYWRKKKNDTKNNSKK